MRSTDVISYDDNHRVATSIFEAALWRYSVIALALRWSSPTTVSVVRTFGTTRGVD